MTVDEVSQLREGDYLWTGTGVVAVRWIAHRGKPFAYVFDHEDVWYLPEHVRPCSKDELVAAGLWKDRGTVVV